MLDILGTIFLIGGIGSFAGGGHFGGILLIALSLLCYRISYRITYRKESAIIKNSNHVIKELKKREKDLMENTVSEVKKKVSARVMTKNKTGDDNLDYTICLKSENGEIFTLTGYENYMKCYEGQIIKLELLYKMDKDNTILDISITDYSFV